MHVMLCFCWLLVPERPDNPLQMRLSINQQLCHSCAASSKGFSIVALEGVAWLLFCLALDVTVLPIVVLL